MIVILININCLIILRTNCLRQANKISKKIVVLHLINSRREQFSFKQKKKSNIKFHFTESTVRILRFIANYSVHGGLKVQTQIINREMPAYS